MDDIQNLLWIGYLCAVYYLRKTGRGNRLLIWGLMGMGLHSLFWALLQWRILPYDFIQGMEGLPRLVNSVSVLLLIVGVIVMALGWGGGGTGLGHVRPLDAAGQNLATLFIPRNETNTYSRAEKLRDAVCERLVQCARERSINVIVQKSNAHSPTVWFRVDYLLPVLARADPNLSLRAHVEITVERYDYHRFENLLTVTAKVGVLGKTILGVIDIDDDAALRIHDFITGTAPRLSLPNRVRQFPWALWLPRNKVVRLGPDWPTLGASAAGMLLFLAPMAGSSFALGPLAAIVLFVWLYFHNRHRRTHILTTGRPLTDPRALIWMDSWQVTIVGLGTAVENLQQAVINRLGTSAPSDLVVGVERIGYWGVDSRVERDQLVIRYRHALGFVHLVAYGENLYVAWESHINAAAWAEETLAQGVDKSTGLVVHANRVVSGYKKLNEYDVADSNFLAEWIHESVKREIKLKMAEHRIDQEIDFTVQRESRKDALAEQTESSPMSRQRQKSSRIQRIG